MRRSVFLVLSFMLVFTLTACAGNTVRLLYGPSDPGSLPASSSKRVTVVMLDDKRNQQAIGVRSNGTPFASTSSVVDWASRTLGESIMRQGVQVSYAMTMAEAKRAKPDYIVSGSLNEVWLQEQSAASLLATVRMSLAMTDAQGKTVYSENLTASQERKALLTKDVENLLVDTLRECVGPASRTMTGLLR